MMKKIIIALFLLSVFTMSFLPTKDPDFGWHYRYGKGFIKDKIITENNSFSYFLPNYKSAYPHLLYDTILAWIYDHLGFNGLSLLYSFTVGICSLTFIYLLSGPLWLRMFAFYATYFLSYPVFGLGMRSQILTYTFFLTTLFILKKAKRKYSYLFYLPFLFLVWVNTHIGFFIGLILFLFWITDLSQKRRLMTMGIFLISLSVTLLNPFGIDVYKEILRHAFSPLGKMIAEWVPPPLWQKLIIALAGIAGLILIIKQKHFSVFKFLMLAFFGVLAFLARRNLPFFYTVTAYILLDQKIIKNKLIQANFMLPSSLTALIFFFSVINIPRTIKFSSSWKKYCTQGVSVYPCQAIQKYPSLHGNVYAAYEWGGFLIWRKPDIKVFVDGRMPAWKDKNGESPYKVYLDIIQTQPGWNKKLKKWKTDYLLISRRTFLDLLLQKEAKKYGWQDVYHDKGVVIYKKI